MSGRGTRLPISANGRRAWRQSFRSDRRSPSEHPELRDQDDDESSTSSFSRMDIHRVGDPDAKATAISSSAPSMEELVVCMTKRMAFVVSPSFSLVLLSGSVASPQSVQGREPIIDMHLHAHTLSMYGTPPPAVCTNDQELFYPALGSARTSDVRTGILLPRTRSERPRRTRNSSRSCSRCSSHTTFGRWRRGRVEEVAKWRAAAPDRIIPATPFDGYQKRTAGGVSAPDH